MVLFEFLQCSFRCQSVKMHHLITLALMISAALLVEIKCQTTNSTNMTETTTTTIVPSKVNTIGADETANITEKPEVLCGAPGPFPNGWIDATQNLPLGMSNVGRSIVYRCNKNMKQIGASNAICEISGRWSNNPPQCLFFCNVPAVDHGVIGNVSTGSIISHGDKVILECTQSYQPAHGLSTYICDNGTLNVTPRCDPAPKGNCERPEIPNGTFVQVDGKNVTDNQIYDVCTEIIYQCENPDHRLIENSNTTENSRRFCDASTQNWTGSPPKCAETCGSLHLHFPFNVTYDETVLAGERYQNGTKAIISCPENNNNNKTMICQSNGTWLGGDVPKCYPPVEHLVLSEIAITVACLVLILILFMAAVFLYNTRSRQPQPNNPASSTGYVRSNSTDSQRMRAELLRQIRRKSFYSLEDPPAGEREYATIHRTGQTMRRPRLTVQYGKLG